MRPNARLREIVIRNVDDETLIYDLKASKAICLNHTAAVVWELCDGKRTFDDILDEMSIRLKSPVSKDYLWIAIEGLHREGLLEDDGEIRAAFDEIPRKTRRDIIRNVGFASMIALPIVASIVAPPATAALSLGVPLDPCLQCTSPPDCDSGHCRPERVFPSMPTGIDICGIPNTPTFRQPGVYTTVCADPGDCATATTAIMECCSGEAVNSTSMIGCSQPTRTRCACY